jgi:hypothetical protein
VHHTKCFCGLIHIIDNHLQQLPYVLRLTCVANVRYEVQLERLVDGAQQARGLHDQVLSDDEDLLYVATLADGDDVWLTLSITVKALGAGTGLTKEKFMNC